MAERNASSEMSLASSHRLQQLASACNLATRLVQGGSKQHASCFDDLQTDNAGENKLQENLPEDRRAFASASMPTQYQFASSAPLGDECEHAEYCPSPAGVLGAPSPARAVDASPGHSFTKPASPR